MLARFVQGVLSSRKSLWRRRWSLSRCQPTPSRHSTCSALQQMFLQLLLPRPVRPAWVQANNK
eukprot:7090355-Karenia_brevis.AAC.1